MSDDTGSWLSDAVAEGREVVREVTTFLGVQREAFVCPTCNAACEETYTHDPQRAAFDGGESPAWKCGKCETHYVRERGDDVHTLDQYGRGLE